MSPEETRSLRPEIAAMWASATYEQRQACLGIALRAECDFTRAVRLAAIIHHLAVTGAFDNGTEAP